MKHKVLLVSMPWASAKRPLLGIGILQSKLAREGFSAKSLYLNVDFSQTFGFENYEFFADNPSLYPLAEFLFSAIFFDYPPQKIDDFVRKSFGAEFLQDNPAIHNSIHNLRNNIIPRFIDDALNQILETGATVIGFSSTFNQIFPGLVMAKRIKEISPSKIIILGGSCFHDEMGIEYSLAFKDIVDYVFTGEADNSLPNFMKYLEGNLAFEEIDGIAHQGVVMKDSLPIANLTDTAIPDYDDYFDAMQKVYGPTGLKYVEGLPFESSRGCWWGQKNHCTFCGLNNMGINYRSKNDSEIINELQYLSSKYKMLNFLASDNIIQHSAYSTTLVKLSELPYKFNLFYEVKANLKRQDLFTLHNSGVNWIQPGIESFSNNILRLMKKGVTGLVNIQLLKIAKEYKINVSYNILTGFYGETDVDYQEMETIISKILHLQPPSGMPSVVQVHRFSPMHKNPAGNGFSSILPCSYYDDWFPEKLVDKNKIAYFFEGYRNFELVNTDGLNSIVSKWIANESIYYAALGYDFILITKKEKDKEIEQTCLDEIDSLLFMLTDEVVHLSTIINQMSSIIDKSELTYRLNGLTDRQILITEEDKYLNIIPFANPLHPKDIKSWIEMAYGRIMKKHDQPNFIPVEVAGS